MFATPNAKRGPADQPNPVPSSFDATSNNGKRSSEPPTAADVERLVGPIALTLHRGPHSVPALDAAALDRRLMATHCGTAVVPLRLAWFDPKPPYTVCDECERVTRERAGSR